MDVNEQKHLNANLSQKSPQNQLSEVTFFVTTLKIHGNLFVLKQGLGIGLQVILMQQANLPFASLFAFFFYFFPFSTFLKLHQSLPWRSSL